MSSNGAKSLGSCHKCAAGLNRGRRPPQSTGYCAKCQIHYHTVDCGFRFVIAKVPANPEILAKCPKCSKICVCSGGQVECHAGNLRAKRKRASAKGQTEHNGGTASESSEEKLESKPSEELATSSAPPPPPATPTPGSMVADFARGLGLALPSAMSDQKGANPVAAMCAAYSSQGAESNEYFARAVMPQLVLTIVDLQNRNAYLQSELERCQQAKRALEQGHPPPPSTLQPAPFPPPHMQSFRLPQFLRPVPASGPPPATPPASKEASTAEASKSSKRERAGVNGNGAPKRPAKRAAWGADQPAYSDTVLPHHQTGASATGSNSAESSAALGPWGKVVPGPCSVPTSGSSGWAQPIIPSSTQDRFMQKIPVVEQVMEPPRDHIYQYAPQPPAVPIASSSERHSVPPTTAAYEWVPASQHVAHSPYPPEEMCDPCNNPATTSQVVREYKGKMKAAPGVGGRAEPCFLEFLLDFSSQGANGEMEQAGSGAHMDGGGLVYAPAQHGPPSADLASLDDHLPGLFGVVDAPSRGAHHHYAVPDGHPMVSGPAALAGAHIPYDNSGYTSIYMPGMQQAVCENYEITLVPKLSCTIIPSIFTSKEATTLATLVLRCLLAVVSYQIAACFVMAAMQLGHYGSIVLMDPYLVFGHCLQLFMALVTMTTGIAAVRHPERRMRMRRLAVWMSWGGGSGLGWHITWLKAYIMLNWLILAITVGMIIKTILDIAASETMHHSVEQAKNHTDFFIVGDLLGETVEIILLVVSTYYTSQLIGRLALDESDKPPVHSLHETHQHLVNQLGPAAFPKRLLYLQHLAKQLDGQNAALEEQLNPLRAHLLAHASPDP